MEGNITDTANLLTPQQQEQGQNTQRLHQKESQSMMPLFWYKHESVLGISRDDTV
jgi:hypothetical protein